MKQTKNLNLKNMKETLVNYSNDQKEFDTIWRDYWQMAYLGFISKDTWRKFCEQCSDWYFDEEENCIKDKNHQKVGK